MWVKSDESPTLGPFTGNSGIKQIPSDLSGVLEVLFGDFLFKYCVKKLVSSVKCHSTKKNVS
jgi:hypothetical protein